MPKTQNDFEAEMATYEDDWKESQEGTFSGELLPDGEHDATIRICRVERPSWDDAGWQWAIMFANNDGTVWLNHDLLHEVGRSIAAQNAARLGYRGSVAKLKEACEQGIFDDLICRIKVATKAGDTRDFTQVYIQRCYGKADQGMAAATPDDDIPF